MFPLYSIIFPCHTILAVTQLAATDQTKISQHNRAIYARAFSLRTEKRET
jgi:hypothetical protein